MNWSDCHVEKLWRRLLMDVKTNGTYLAVQEQTMLHVFPLLLPTIATPTLWTKKSGTQSLYRLCVMINTDSQMSSLAGLAECVMQERLLTLLQIMADNWNPLPTSSEWGTPVWQDNALVDMPFFLIDDPAFPLTSWLLKLLTYTGKLTVEQSYLAMPVWRSRTHSDCSKEDGGVTLRRLTLMSILDQSSWLQLSIYTTCNQQRSALPTRLDDAVREPHTDQQGPQTT